MTEIVDFTTGFWSGWVAVITVVGILFLATLLLSVFSASGRKIKSEEEVWDNDLREGNAEPPKWWFYLYLSMIVFSCVYLVLYPGLGSWKGTLGWTQFHQYKNAEEYHAAQFGDLRDKWINASFAELATDETSMTTAAQIFVDNCSACHGRDGEGQANLFPSLVDDDWLWGGSAEDVHASIANGRNSVMVAHSAILGGPQAVSDMADYVLFLAGQEQRTDAMDASADQFSTTCSVCHGVDGTGNTSLGAPNLTDGIWLYGGEKENLVETISLGRNGVMPAQLERLGPARTRLLAAWVVSGKIRELSSTEH